MKSAILLIILYLNIISYANNNIKDEIIVNSKSFFPSVENVLDYFENLDKQDYEVKVIENYVIKKDAADFEFIKGNLIFLPPINNSKKLVIYIGKGNFQFTPPSKIEKEQLFRHYGNSQYKVEFKNLFIYSDDQTIDKLYKASKYLEKSDYYKIKKVLKNCKQYINNSDFSHVRDIIFSILNNQNLGLFFAQINQDDYHPVFYINNPYKDESIRFMSRIDPRYFHNIPEIISQFKSVVQLTSTKNKENDLTIKHYYINCKISEELEFSAEAEIEFEINDKEIHWFCFNLFSELIVDSVALIDGTKLPFYKGEENSTLWIKLDNFNSGNQKLIVYYHGELFENKRMKIYMKDQFSWYPLYLMNKSKCTFEIDYQYPKDVVLFSVGKKIFREETDDFRLANWITFNPIRFAIFSIGYYNNAQIYKENIPQVAIYSYSKPIDYNDIPESQKKEFGIEGYNDDIDEDIIKSLNFLQNIFGRAPFSQVYVIETPYVPVNTQPGLLYIPNFAFRGYTAFELVEKIYRVSFQWWGLTVKTENYHDDWITEGLSQYLGLLYLQNALNATKNYNKYLDFWKYNIINNRKHPIADGVKPGPVWLGYRNVTSTTRGDYYKLITQKSTWTFHMLRYLMFDYEKNSDAKFLKMLQDVYISFKDKNITTEDIKSKMEFHSNINLDWFFNQWIYGTDIPFYRVKYKILNGPDPKRFSVVFHVNQENVNDDFQMYVPVKIVYNNKVFHRERVLIKGKVSSFVIEDLKFLPQKVIFNDYNAVLCEYEIDEWE